MALQGSAVRIRLAPLVGEPLSDKACGVSRETSKSKVNSLGQGRPGGNPDLKQHQFTTGREEPLLELMAVRVSASMKARLRGLEDWQEFVRSAIAKKLEREAP